MKYTANNLLLSITFACGATLGSAFVYAQPAESTAKPQTLTLRIQGGITKELTAKVKDALQKVTGDPFPAGLIVLLDSPGGDGIVAMEVGRLLREAHAHVFVTGKCSSACIFIFMGGVVRQAPDGALGIHRARITRIDPKTKKRVDVDVTLNPTAKQRLDEGNRLFRDYVQDMGILAQFSAAMDEIPSDNMRWLTRAESKNLGIIGFEPSYLSNRERVAAAKLGTRPGDIERNTDQVINKCLDDATNPAGNFVRCYRLLLNRPKL